MCDDSVVVDDAAVERVSTLVEERLRALTDLSAPSLRRLRRELSREVRRWPAGDVLSLADRVLASRSGPRRFLAYELINKHKAALRSLGTLDLEELGRGLGGWGDVDMFGVYLSGPAWRERQVSDAVIEGWADSDDRWWRRAAVVSTVPLNSKARGGDGDAARTLKICDRLKHDRDDMVVKAVSWALRELAKRDPGAVRRYLYEHGDKLAPRVRREVTNKLNTGLKNPRGSTVRS